MAEPRAVIGVPGAPDRDCGCPDDAMCGQCAPAGWVPVKLAVGHDDEPDAIAWIDRADLADDARGALAQVLRGAADHLEQDPH